MSSSHQTDRIAPVLTVDVEDWFHVCGQPSYSDPGTWAGREKRVHAGVERVLALLDDTGSSATFFVLGWIARENPALVRRIADAGHEIACHGDRHRRVFEMTLPEFRDDVRKSRDTLQEIAGRPVTSFRAPEWSLGTAANPAFEVLVEEGFTLDSSLTTAPPVGDPSNPARPAMLETPSGPILEVPPLMGTFFGFPAIWGGGVCSRMTRESRIAVAIDRALAEGVAPVLYAHPWEFDDAHPKMPGLSPVARLVHFAGRTRTEERWRRFLKRWKFAQISSVQTEKDRDRISRMTDVKGPRPLRGARSAPLTSDIREEDFLLSGLHGSPDIRKISIPGATASAAAAYKKNSVET